MAIKYFMYRLFQNLGWLVIILGLIYIVLGFCNWSLSFGDWNWFSRFIMGIATLVMFIATYQAMSTVIRRIKRGFY